LSEPPPLAESIFKKIFSIERVHANLPFPEVPLSEFTQISRFQKCPIAI
jgi:hypothetical protein